MAQHTERTIFSTPFQLQTTRPWSERNPSGIPPLSYMLRQHALTLGQMTHTTVCQARQSTSIPHATIKINCLIWWMEEKTWPSASGYNWGQGIKSYSWLTVNSSRQLQKLGSQQLPTWPHDSRQSLLQSQINLPWLSAPTTPCPPPAANVSSSISCLLLVNLRHHQSSKLAQHYLAPLQPSTQLRRPAPQNTRLLPPTTSNMELIPARVTARN